MKDEEVDFGKLVTEAVSLLDSHGDIESVIQGFREAGASKSMAVRLLAQSSGKGRREAMRIVHASRAYEAQREVDEAVQAEVLDHLERIGDSTQGE